MPLRIQVDTEYCTGHMVSNSKDVSLPDLLPGTPDVAAAGSCHWLDLRLLVLQTYLPRARTSLQHFSAATSQQPSEVRGGTGARD